MPQLGERQHPAHQRLRRPDDEERPDLRAAPFDVAQRAQQVPGLAGGLPAVRAQRADQLDEVALQGARAASGQVVPVPFGQLDTHPVVLGEPLVGPGQRGPRGGRGGGQEPGDQLGGLGPEGRGDGLVQPPEQVRAEHGDLGGQPVEGLALLTGGLPLLLGKPPTSGSSRSLICVISDRIRASAAPIASRSRRCSSASRSSRSRWDARKPSSSSRVPLSARSWVRMSAISGAPGSGARTPGTAPGKRSPGTAGPEPPSSRPPGPSRGANYATRYGSMNGAATAGRSGRRGRRGRGGCRRRSPAGRAW